ncbi:hypothetical protein M0R45_008676 [Rubus argutus]|uniref:C3H1-type domain-containing protein n=1 Tax=Rubus argutus TaxID=59490 RepID=A0AAW1Y2U4_RUBAR
MAIKAVKRPTNRSEISVYSRPGGGGLQKTAVCKFWLAGICKRSEISCRFLHTEAPPTPVINPHSVKQKALVWKKEENITRRDNAESFTQKNIKSVATQESTVMQKRMATQQSLATHKSIPTEQGIPTEQSIPTQKSIATQKNNAILKPLEKVCTFWANGRCMKGDRCPCLHTWFRGDGFSMLAKLQDHKKMVTGIVLPEGSCKLYSASKDGTVRVWDCHTGRCGSVINLGGQAGSLYSKGPWVFAGAPNVVKAWNIQTNAEFSLSAPAGQVHAMEVGNEMLFAGTQEGVILLKPTGFISGSVDHTIRVWDLNTLQSIMTLNGHSDVVTSLIFWDQCLISCSLDCTIKVWAETGNLEATYTPTQERGLLGLSGMADAEAKPVLLCSCNDKSVRLYELPSFAERGRLFAKEEIGAIQVGPGGLFFSGDATGLPYCLEVGGTWPQSIVFMSSRLPTFQYYFGLQEPLRHNCRNCL